MAQRINSRTKGSRNERSVADVMKQWTGYEFARTPQSGGLHWKKKNTTGDVICIDEKHGLRFPLTIECKAHHDLDFSYMLDGTIGKKTNKIIRFWDQALRESEEVNKIPMLTIRRNGMPKDTHFIVFQSFFINPLLEKNMGIIFEYGVMTYTNRSTNLKLTIMNSRDLVKLDYTSFYKYSKKFLRNGKRK